MQIDFCKYQGAGNDFVMLDNTDGKYDALTPTDVAKLCDRRFGIGGDGLLLICKEEGVAFRMVYYNQDGSRASFCGNGARCICAFAERLGVVEKGRAFSFVADDGMHVATCLADGSDWVDLRMCELNGVVSEPEGSYVMNTGVPHYVRFVDSLPDVDIMSEGPAVRFAERYKPAGVNVNFVGISGERSIEVRTYERGVEAETLACGTGITACSIATAFKLGADGKLSFDVKAQGGDLRVDFEKQGDAVSDIHLCGPAKFVFSGVMSL